MHTQLMSTGEVAALLAIKRYQLEYALSEGLLPETRARFLGKRCFSPDEVRVVAAYFGKEVPNNENSKGDDLCSHSPT
jgi:hypothetical protein